MTFAEGVANLAKKIRDTRSVIETEEATKTAFIMPFISNVLGRNRACSVAQGGVSGRGRRRCLLPRQPTSGRG